MLCLRPLSSTACRGSSPVAETAAPFPSRRMMWDKSEADFCPMGSVPWSVPAVTCSMAQSLLGLISANIAIAIEIEFTSCPFQRRTRGLPLFDRQLSTNVQLPKSNLRLMAQTSGPFSLVCLLDLVSHSAHALDNENSGRSRPTIGTTS